MEMSEALSNYDDLVKKGYAPEFTATSIYELIELEKDPIMIIFKALDAGYALGYEEGKRHQKEDAQRLNAIQNRCEST